MPNLELFVPLHTLSLLMHGLVITHMKLHHHPPLFLCTRAWDSPAALGTVDGRRCPLIPIKSLAKAGPAALLYRRQGGCSQGQKNGSTEEGAGERGQIGVIG